MVGGAPLLCDLSLFHIFIILFFTIFILVNTVPATYCSLSLVKFYSKVSVVIESFWYRHSFHSLAFKKFRAENDTGQPSRN